MESESKPHHAAISSQSAYIPAAATESRLELLSDEPEIKPCVNWTCLFLLYLLVVSAATLLIFGMGDIAIFVIAGLAFVGMCNVHLAGTVLKEIFSEAEPVNPDEAHAKIEELQAAAPKIIFCIRCYHMESRTTRRKNSEGKMEEHTEWVKVYTHKASQEFVFCRQRDISKAIPEEAVNGKYPNLLLNVEHRFIFSNDETAKNFEEQKEAFYAANTRDDSQDKTVERTLGNLQGPRKQLLIQTEFGKKDKLISKKAAYASVCCFWFPCWRKHYDAASVRAKYEILKEIDAFNAV